MKGEILIAAPEVRKSCFELFTPRHKTESEHTVHALHAGLSLVIQETAVR